MSRNLAITFFMSAIMLYAFGQESEMKRIRLSGRIMEEKEKPVSYAHILEMSRNEGWISDYYGRFFADVFPGDTLIVSAISYHHARISIPHEFIENGYEMNIILQPDTVMLKELVIHPWPATFSRLRGEFLDAPVSDPDSEINLNMPSMKEMANMLKTPGIPGQVGIYSGPGPLSILYDKFSREARNKRNFDMAMKMEKANSRYNKVVVSKITGLKKEEDIQRFMLYCDLQVKFILESMDYELYAAIVNCFTDFCNAGLLDPPNSN